MEKTNFMSSILMKGGIRLKLMVTITMILVLSIGFISFFSFPIIEKTIQEKAFNVCEVSAQNISAAGGEALLSGQKIMLEDILRGVLDANIEGMLEVSVIFKDKYFVNSIKEKSQKPIEESVKISLSSIKGSDVTSQKGTYEKDGKTLEVYEFYKPILYQTRTIGYTRIVFSEEAIYGSLRKLKSLGTTILIIALGVSLLIIFFMANSFSKPILKIAKASQMVNEGNLDIRLDINQNDEVGFLAERFNQMVSGLKEKFHMMKFVSGSTVNMIKSNLGETEMKLGGQRTNLAFFFSDVRGFTAWSEKTTPEEVVSVLNHYLDLQSEIIQKYHGDIDKYVGDEIMAVFSGEDKEDNCLRASIEVIAAIKRENETRVSAGQTPLTVGIGVHCGDVVVGNMGSKNRMDFTAIGDTVNLSARLCSAAEPLHILASGQIIEKSKHKDQFDLRELEPVKVKGKEKPISVYNILGMKG
ncbi:MAG: HAMP domain-containing protein [Leptospiraceae bacterium]|nr:HAMP domain-containing protein [Leptospiraceae bacterium]MCP5511122.1 HAMP domain-containing protein [Leptospiraceae bacterium]